MFALKGVTIALLCIAMNARAVTVINYMVIQDQAQPFQNHQNKKDHSGIITDIIRKIFTSPQYQIKIHTLPFNRMISMLEKGDLKNWITFGSPNWPGIQSENLSQLPVFKVRHSLLTSNKQNFDINSAEDIFGKTMVLLHGFDYPGLEEHIASKDIKAIKVKNYKSAFKVVNRLKEKAGFVEMDIRIKYNLKMLALAEQDYNWHNFSKIITDYNLHLAMSPSFDKALQQHVEVQLAELKASGILAEIINSY